MADAFWAKVDKTRHCWLWQGAVDGRGYGQVTLTQAQLEQLGSDHFRTLRAHRVALMIHTGEPIPEGATVDHRCRNHACVKPRHLIAGPHWMNNRRTRESAGVIRERKRKNGTTGYMVIWRDYPDRQGKPKQRGRTFDTPEEADAFLTELIFEHERRQREWLR